MNRCKGFTNFDLPLKRLDFNLSLELHLRRLSLNRSLGWFRCRFGIYRKRVIGCFRETDGSLVVHRPLFRLSKACKPGALGCSSHILFHHCSCIHYALLSSSVHLSLLYIILRMVNAPKPILGRCIHFIFLPIEL